MDRGEFGPFFQAQYTTNRDMLPIIGVKLPN
jgi:hypothetical protein